MEMPSKTCELDLIPTEFLKNVLCALYTYNNQSCQFIIKHRGNSMKNES